MRFTIKYPLFLFANRDVIEKNEIRKLKKKLIELIDSCVANEHEDPSTDNSRYLDRSEQRKRRSRVNRRLP